MLYKSRSIPKDLNIRPSLTKYSKNQTISSSPSNLRNNNKFLIQSPSCPRIINYMNSTLPYNEYSSLLQTSMKKYKGISPIDLDDTNINVKTILNETQHFITKEEKTYIEKVSKMNTLFSFSKSKPFPECTNTKIFIPTHSADYYNAIHSLGVLKSNNSIVDKINKTNASRQKILYDKSIRTFENFKMKYKMKMPKIKITTMIHKSPSSSLSSYIPIVKEKSKEDDDNDDDQQIRNISNENNKLNQQNVLVAYYRYPNKNFPECREQFSLVINKENIILLGGMCSVMQTTFIWNLNLNKLQWKRIKANNTCYNKFGHTCVLLNRKLYVFGGRTKMDNNNTNKETVDIVNGLDVFNLDDETWSSPALSTRNAPRPRRNHIAELVGMNMVIHGGIDDNNEILDSVYVLSLQQPMKWVKPSFPLFNKGPALYGHCSSLVVPLQIKTHFRFNIFKYPDNCLGKNYSTPIIKMVGVYIFGGMCQDDLVPTNDMWILMIGKKPFEWKKIDDVKGVKPTPRYFHSMNYYEPGNFLIVHGGRNDTLNDSFALNDTYVFKLDRYEWMKIELYSQLSGFKVLCRCAHSAVVYTNKLIVFGGMNSLNYLGSALLIVNLDWEENWKMKFVEEDKKKEDNDNDDDEVVKKKVKQFSLAKYSLGVITHFELPPIQ